jgi:tRNA pseudouridine38-40 synthase
MNSVNPSETPACVAKLLLAYDGSDFHGWQVQPGLRTVQGCLMEALNRLFPREGIDGIPPGAGRTDAGVHAWGQVSSVALADVAMFLRMERALPRMLPEDILLREIVMETPGFHARHSARGRSYRYSMLREPDPFLRRQHWLVEGELDIEEMQRACRYLPGEHHFESFCVTASVEEGRTNCRVERAELERDGARLHFHISADRFLHSMVRSIVGTLVEVGRGRRAAGDMEQILRARDRSAAGPTAPPQGLSLEEVRYSETVMPEHRQGEG